MHIEKIVLYLNQQTHTTMTTYGGKYTAPRAYNRTAPTKYDYLMALQNAGINFRISTPINALKAACEKNGIEVIAK